MIFIGFVKYISAPAASAFSFDSKSANPELTMHKPLGIRFYDIYLFNSLIVANPSITGIFKSIKITI